MNSSPLVSCIMPTRGRQQWAAEAVEMFHQQDYAEKELVIIDELMEPSFPGGIDAPNVQYHRAPRLTIGAKRNLAVSRASGDVIAHWDSDDTYRSERLSKQVAHLLSDNRLELVGFHRMEFVDANTGERFMYHASEWNPIGVSMVYWREAWELRMFNDVQSGEDVEFARDRRVACLPADGLIVARVHNGNTSEKRGPIATNPNQWRKLA